MAVGKTGKRSGLAQMAAPKRSKTPAISSSAPPRSTESPTWTFLTNHSHVLITLGRSPELTLREVAQIVGITERAVQGIVAELEEGGILTRERDGRRNRYKLHTDRPLRHPVESNRTVANLLKLME